MGLRSFLVAVYGSPLPPETAGLPRRKARSRARVPDACHAAEGGIGAAPVRRAAETPRGPPDKPPPPVAVLIAAPARPRVTFVGTRRV